MSQPPYALPEIRHPQVLPHHYTATPAGVARPKRHIFLHCTEGSHSLPWLTTDPVNNTSAHTLADRAGVLWELVAPNDRAHHAGLCVAPYSNVASLGIEFENRSRALPPVRREAYPRVQILAGAYRVATWRFSFGIPWEAVVRHGDVARPVGRRCDPSFFPMEEFRAACDTWLRWLESLPPDEHAHWIR